MLNRVVVSLLSVFLYACDGSDSTAASKPQASAEAAPEAKAPSPAKKDALPPVDAKEAEAGATALAEASPQMQPPLAAKALAQLEAKRLPPSLIEGLDALTDAPADQRAMLLAKSISENIGLLDKACETDGRAMMTSMATVAPEARDAKVWQTCKFPRLGLVTEGDLANADPMLAMVAHMVFVHLDAGSTVSKAERTLLQTMMKKAP